MAQRGTDEDIFGRKVLLVVFAIAATAGPLAVWLWGAPQVRGLAIQSLGPTPLSFEVASVKLCKLRSPLPGLHLLNDRFNATARAISLIANAYDHDGLQLGDEELSGGPDWVRSDLFDIDAKIDDSLVEGQWRTLSFKQKWEQAMLMLQSLLVDRFKLKVRKETKELPVYELA
jgi:uncharacterized protein (TIGR03435 family)